MRNFEHSSFSPLDKLRDERKREEEGEGEKREREEGKGYKLIYINCILIGTTSQARES